MGIYRRYRMEVAGLSLHKSRPRMYHVGPPSIRTLNSIITPKCCVQCSLPPMTKGETTAKFEHHKTNRSLLCASMESSTFYKNTQYPPYSTFTMIKQLLMKTTAKERTHMLGCKGRRYNTIRREPENERRRSLETLSSASSRGLCHSHGPVTH
ncbi:hypothetical protein K491DRAFT_454463 [Lophiostoma macrostomum CBS 122681]|uniref:Uncharacterized protein n=1 Tax=Lophiostoma macrostomum CBS 122681 TaxID=1314788 RepID=A0A6A6TMZ8_9PLEO|nr:hypothetical protein K491DRAFT_454463 [Lophiostoma macrostomum CBS 122681]